MKRKVNLTAQYAEAAVNGLPAIWALLNHAQRAYARYLVEEYGTPAKIAMQHSFIFGFDEWSYDYRRNMLVRETRVRESFGF